MKKPPAALVYLRAAEVSRLRDWCRNGQGASRADAIDDAPDARDMQRARAAIG